MRDVWVVKEIPKLPLNESPPKNKPADWASAKAHMNNLIVFLAAQTGRCRCRTSTASAARHSKIRCSMADTNILHYYILHTTYLRLLYYILHTTTYYMLHATYCDCHCHCLAVL